MRIFRAFKVFFFVLFSKNKYNVKKGDISDGYHTFNELYEFKMLYNAAFVNEYIKTHPHAAEKATRHSDGKECFGGGWFVVNVMLPTGLISNHYKLNFENEFLFNCEDKFIAKFKYDGHTNQDVVERLKKFNINH